MPFSGIRKKLYNQQQYARQARRTESPIGPEKKRLVTFRLHESIIARCHRLKEEAITNGRYPWRTIGEVYRGLIIKGMETLKGDAIVDEGLPYLALVRQVEGMRQPRIEAESIAHNAQTELQRLLSIGAKREAQQFYVTTVRIAEEMAPTVWRDWLLDRLRREFQPLHRALEKGETKELAIPLKTQTAKASRKRARR